MTPTIELLKSHTSVRSFSDKPVSDADFTEIIAAAQATASSSFVQATTIIRVRNAETREQLATISGGQKYVAEAPVFAVFCADLQRANTCCQLNNSTMNSGFMEHFIIATVDVALMAQSAVVAAESMGLGICYIGALRNDPQAVSDLLALPEFVYPVFGLCLGYPAAENECKPRLPMPIVLKEETYNDTGDTPLLHEYDSTLRDYYANRSSNQKASGWTEQMTGLMTREARPHMLDYLKSRGFCKK